MTKTIDCAECGRAVPSGRLSCPSCGALLASITSLDRPFAGVADPSPSLRDEPAPHDPPDMDDTPTPRMDAPVRVPWASSADGAPVLVGRAYGGAATTATGGPASPTVPGAYRPPTLALSAAPSRGLDRSSAPATGAATTAPSPMRLPVAADGWLGSTTLDHARLVEIAGWFVVIGSSMAVLGFLLPWSVVVIGARGTGGYLDDWGLAGPSHLFVLAGLLVVLALGVIRTPVPAWLRTGVSGLALGSLLFGMLWPYVIGPLGADIGALVTTLGAASLVIGGAVASWSSRHVETGPPV